MPPLALFCSKHLPILFLNNQNLSLIKCILNSLSFCYFCGVKLIPHRRHHSPAILHDLVKMSQLQRRKGNLIRKRRSCISTRSSIHSRDSSYKQRIETLWRKRKDFKCYFIFLLRLFFLFLPPCGFYNPKCWNFLEH